MRLSKVKPNYMLSPEHRPDRMSHVFNKRADESTLGGGISSMTADSRESDHATDINRFLKEIKGFVCVSGHPARCYPSWVMENKHKNIEKLTTPSVIFGGLRDKRVNPQLQHEFQLCFERSTVQIVSNENCTHRLPRKGKHEGFNE